MREQGEALPPPDDAVIFFAETQRVADLIGCGFDRVENVRAIFWRGRGGFEVPSEIRLLHRLKGGVKDFESARVNEFLPCSA